MGLAASQGRYLCLTARMNDLVYEGQQISQQRLNLAKETQQIADKYNERINNKKMVVNMYTGNDNPSTTLDLTYDLLTKTTEDGGLNLRVIDKYGYVVVPSRDNSISATYKDETGISKTEKFYSIEKFIEKFMPDLTDEEKEEVMNLTMEGVKNYYENSEKYATEDKATLEMKQSYPPHITNGSEEKLCIDENVVKKEYLQSMLSSGEWYIEQVTNPETQEWEKLVWQGSNFITEIYDTSDDAAAESEYEADMLELERRDKLLEMRLEQVQTEEKAVETEIESVKNIIKKNIETSFKTFA